MSASFSMASIAKQFESTLSRKAETRNRGTETVSIQRAAGAFLLFIQPLGKHDFHRELFAARAFSCT